MERVLRKLFEDSHKPMLRLVVSKKRNALIDGLFSGTAYKMTR